MPQKTFAGGLAPQKNMKNTLLPAALCLLSACDNGAPAVVAVPISFHFEHQFNPVKGAQPP